MGFNAYVLDEETRQELLEIFPPKYPLVIAEHITQHFGVSKDTPIPPADSIRIIGEADDGRGLQGLIVEINGERTRPDGKPFHITWSLNPQKMAPAALDPAPLGKQKAKTYRAFHTNNLVALGAYASFLDEPVEIQAHAQFLVETEARLSAGRG